MPREDGVAATTLARKTMFAWLMGGLEQAAHAVARRSTTANSGLNCALRRAECVGQQIKCLRLGIEIHPPATKAPSTQPAACPPDFPAALATRPVFAKNISPTRAVGWILISGHVGEERREAKGQAVSVELSENGHQFSATRSAFVDRVQTN